MRHQYGISVSLLRRRFARAQVVTSRNMGCFLRLLLGVHRSIPVLIRVAVIRKGESTLEGTC